MKKILTLTDFSSVANHAIEVALILAKQYGAELEIFHVMTTANHVMYELDADPELHIRDKNNVALNASLECWKKMAEGIGVKAILTLGSGEPIRGIIDRIKQQEIDLLVMGSTGLDKSNMDWGTTTQQVIKKVAIPVLVIKSKIENFQLNQIVFASDLELEDQEIFKKAIKLMEPPKECLIHFMTVNTSNYYSQPRVIIKSALKDFQKIAEPYRSEASFYADYSVSSGIRHFLDEVDPDLLIMSNRDRNLLKEFVKPNAAIEAVGKVSYPVLILK